MGDAGGQGGAAARLTAEPRAAGGGWAAGPKQMYARLAGALVDKPMAARQACRRRSAARYW